MAVENCANRGCPRDEADTDTECTMLTLAQGVRWFCSNECIYESVLEQFVQDGKYEQRTLDDYRRKRRLWL